MISSESLVLSTDRETRATRASGDNMTSGYAPGVALGDRSVGDATPFLSGPMPKRRNWRRLVDTAPGKLTRAERIMAFAERHLVVPEGKLVGKPIKLAGFQEDFFYSVFDNPAGTDEAILSMARKNAKTATIAIIVLAFLVGPEAVENARLASGALSRKQAAEVYNYASKMGMGSPKIRTLIKPVPSSKKLIGLALNTEYEAMAAEGSTAHGGSPLLAILDEAGQVRGPYNAFFEAVETSQDAHENPLRIWISTQAPTDGDLFNMIIDDAELAKDPRKVCHVYRAREDCALDDEQQWHAANPALDVFKNRRGMVSGSEQAARMPSKENGFRWLHLNQRVNPFSPFISRGVWMANGGAVSDEAFTHGRVFGGLDLSQTTDLTAFVLVAHHEGLWHWRARFWMAEGLIAQRSKDDRVPYDLWQKQGYLIGTPGKSVKLDWVARQMQADCAGLDVVEIAYDRYRFALLNSELEREGIDLPLVEFGQGFKSMAPAVDVTEEAMLHDMVRHGGNPVLTMCARNAVVVKDPSGARKLDKSKATGRIDGMVAAVMAMGVASVAVDVIETEVDPARRDLILA